MGIFSRFSKQVPEIEEPLKKMINNAENNYKDNAQQYFKEFKTKLSEFEEEGKLTEKQKAYYEKMKVKYEKDLEGFHH